MKTDGRMIRKSISDSKGFASLSPEAAVLFCMIIPNLDSHGKMNGGPGYIKDEVCPRVSYLTLELLPSLLREISLKTNIKWFDVDGRKYIHSVNFLEKHQNLPLNKIGKDKLPNYSGVTPELLPHEVDLEVEVKADIEVKEEHPPTPQGKTVAEILPFPVEAKAGVKERISFDEVRDLYRDVYRDPLPSVTICHQLEWIAENFDRQTVIDAFAGASSVKARTITYITKPLRNKLEMAEADEKMWRDMGCTQ